MHSNEELVTNFNQQLYELAEGSDSLLEAMFEEYPPLELKSNGYCSHIYFLGQIIWDSENDERPYLEATDDYVSLVSWIEWEIKRIIEIISVLPKLMDKENFNFSLNEKV